jgi:hypothetical protein
MIAPTPEGVSVANKFVGDGVIPSSAINPKHDPSGGVPENGIPRSHPQPPTELRTATCGTSSAMVGDDQQEG